MFSASLPYHNIDPVLFQIGFFELRWYSLAYIIGLVFAWYFGKRIARSNPAGGVTPIHIDDLLFYATLGVIVGARLGYVVFYNLGYYLQHPLNIVKVWDGGMSFHGGMIGVAVSIVAFALASKINMRALGDIVATVAGFGLLFGRLANFINGELYGRVSDVPWAMHFPMAPVTDALSLTGIEYRHPSQLYEAILEGVVVTLICFILIYRKPIRAKAGFVTGVFLAGYGISRVIVEFFRQPDDHLGLLTSGFTMGQWLSFPMIIAGLLFMVWAAKAPNIKVTGYNT
mgnify:CR=1 FL=1